MIIEMVNSAGFLMGDDGRAQSKENKVFMANLAAVMGISMGGRVSRFRAVPQGGDGRRSCRDLPWTHPAWPWPRAKE